MSILNLLEAGGAAISWGGLRSKRSPGRAVRILHSGSSFHEERNIEKRQANADVKRVRAVLVKHHASLPSLGRAPKRDNHSMYRMDVLSNRRLRQLDARRYGC